jgi:hypothetical protein
MLNVHFEVQKKETLLVKQMYMWRYVVTRLVEVQRYNLQGRRFYSRCVHLDFSVTSYFRPHYNSGIDLASERNKYQGYLPGVKVAGEQI